MKKTWHVVANEGDERHPFALVDDEGTIVRVDEDPDHLSKWGLDNGADEVRHDRDHYNLRDAEDARVRRWRKAWDK